MNGRRVGLADAWERPSTFDVAPLLQVGDNVVALHGKNLGGPAALAAWLELRDPHGRSASLVSDALWRVTAKAPADDWAQLRFPATGWEPVSVFGSARAGGTVYDSPVDAAANGVAELIGGIPILIPLAPAAAAAAPPAAPVPQWIWDDAAGKETLWFRKTFDLAALPAAAQLCLVGDEGCRLLVNGVEIGATSGPRPKTFDLAAQLRRGRNVIAVLASNADGPAGVCARCELRDAGGGVTTIVTDASWRLFGDEVRGWDRPDYDDAKWPCATGLGALGADGLPWSLPADGLDLPPAAGGRGR